MRRNPLTYLTDKTITALIFVLLSAALLPAQAAWDDQPKLGYRLTPLAKPVPAPDFTLKDMEEETHRFSDLRGKVVLLNFWATWCPPCRREMPSMERLHQKLDSEKFKVIAINQMEDGDHVFAYIGQLEVDPSFTILFDKDSNVANKYQVRGLPTTFLIDNNAMIRYRAIGGREFDHPEVEKLIKKLMQEPPAN